MNLFFYFFFIIFSIPLFAKTPVNQKIHVFCEANGKGLQKDRDVLLNALTDLNCDVKWIDIKSHEDVSYADINIFVQEINCHYLNFAKINWFIPNPEWYLQELNLLSSIDLILCRTKEVERIFNELNQKTYFLGFTSPDHYQKKIKKKPNTYLHMAGSSEYKGTSAIKTAWLNHKNFPHLTILKQFDKSMKKKNVKLINRYISEKKVLKLQNSSMVHLALSETEGFGHYIMEAMSVGAVVITTDAPPMNEFVQDPRCLVPYFNISRQKLAMKYFVNAKDIEASIQALQRLPVNELALIGAENRKSYLRLTEEFKSNLKTLLEQTSSEL
jgi:glycosyltransferase involved in cell wall biosynthesis